MIDDKTVEQVIQYVRENYEEILRRDPEDVVMDIIYAVKSYGNLAKMYLKMNWDMVRHYIANPMNALEELRKRDQQLYNQLIKHPKWLNRFFRKLYIELKNYVYG